ncbi:lipase thioesterase family protein [Diplodia corticola]|uniref:Lipase thioesterase family protein n=1 Tax=Diplodia corticola TaxID=236234 RepID=A0A1J9RHP6_9PEZI|nr:lipase thioesterase family protein [Diplodia corticola]OJD32075.1 lipase thioesterase family protein [Diplodia corticola]
MAPRPKTTDLRLGFFEKLGLLPIFAAVLGKTFWTALTAKFTSKNKRPSSFARMLGYAALRTLTSHNTSRTEQALAPGTDDAYLAYCKRFNVQPVTETLKDGTCAYWVGSKGAEKVLIYFHGGGYSIPADPAHFTLLHSLTTDLGPSVPGGLAALVLHYDVAPFAAYPRQLGQAARLLNYVLRALRVPPRNVILGGDSAGGNLALALLSHVLHPHPEAAAVPRVELRDFSTSGEGETTGRADSVVAGASGGGVGGGRGEGQEDPAHGAASSGPADDADADADDNRLLAAVLISPWVSFDTTTASFATNRTRDPITPAGLARWSTLFLGGRPTDPYNEPVDVPAGWWKGLGGRVVRDVLFVAGEYEVLLDGILNCAESVRNEWRSADGGEVACVLAEGAGHVSCWLDTMWGFGKEDLKMYTETREWLRGRV